MSRHLGLDPGDRNIGVAVSDELGLIAQPLTALRCPDRRDEDWDLKAVAELVGRVGAAAVVVGVPRNMDGSFGPRAEKSLDFIDRLRARLEVPVHAWDERLTTRAAERLLIAADVSRRRRRQVVDKLSAALILQGYLDHARGCETRGRPAGPLS